MGKKSVLDTPLLPSVEGQGAQEGNLSEERSALAELFRDFVQVAMETQEDTHESSSKNPVSITFSLKTNKPETVSCV